MRLAPPDLFSFSPPGEIAAVSSVVGSSADEMAATSVDFADVPTADTSLPLEVSAAAARGIVRSEYFIGVDHASGPDRCFVDGVEVHPLEIPAFLRRDANNVAPFLADKNVTTSRTLAASAIESADDISKPISMEV